MRLLQICCEMPPFNGGIGTAVADLAPALVREGIELEILGIYPASLLKEAGLPRTDELGGYRVTRIASRWEKFPMQLRLWLERQSLLREVKRVVREKNMDAVLVDDFDGWLPWGTGSKVPLLTRLNGSNLVYDQLLNRPGYAPIHQMENRMLSLSAAWVGVSDFFLERTLAFVPPPGGLRTQVIPNAINAEYFQSARPDLTVPGRIVFHNTLGPRKGVKELFQAFAIVHSQRPDATLILCGSYPDFEPVKRRLLELVPESVRAAINFAGRKNRGGELQEILQTAAVACYPSHLETFGLSPVEAMAMGRVTVFADCGPAREVITDGVDGWICAPKDPESLAAALLKALSMDDDARAAMGRAARSTVLHRFDAKVVAVQWATILRSVIGGSGASDR